MDDINKLLEQTGLSNIQHSGLTIVSLYGISDKSSKLSPVILANRIVKSDVFSHKQQPLKKGTIELVEEGIQLHVDRRSSTVYLFLDSTLDSNVFLNPKKHTVIDYQNLNMKGLLFMFIISHLVIPILPPSLLPSDFLSALVTLSQTKMNMYTHLAQFQSCCWKYWDIPVPFSLFEKKEFDRINPNFLGWWGSAKGVPMLVFVAANVPFSEITPAAIKKTQESLQTRLKGVFRALRLTPSTQEMGNSSNSPVDVKSLFLLPSTTQSIIHVIPSEPKESDYESIYSYDEPLSLSDLLEKLRSSVPTDLPREYGDNLLRNFVTIWTKTATSRHPLHRKMNDSKAAPLPSPVQFASSAIPLLHFLFNQPIRENGMDFREIIISQYSSTKGMIQQIEVILRKKIKENIEIERVFSKNYCHGVMQNCNETYLQDSPSFYPEKYHIWKRDNALQQYRSLARGICKEEYADRLERECDLVWKQDRQSCEHRSLTDRFCRLKIGHEDAPPQLQKRNDRSSIVESGKHSSGFTLFHTCNCGRTQKLRDDPFDILDANYRFYEKFSCCVGKEMCFVDIEASIFGSNQKLELQRDYAPENNSSLLYLGSSSVYKNNVGLDKTEGFLNNTNYLIPWSITTINDIKLHHQEQIVKEPKGPVRSSAKEEWPVLGKLPASDVDVKPTKVVSTVSLEAFPALGFNPAPVPVATPNPMPAKQLFETNENSGGRRKRYNRVRDRLQGLVRGYVGAEYECAKGHRFLSCGEGRVCKLGHASHPKEHGNYFIHQDLKIYMLCPCCYLPNSNTNTGSANHSNEVTAQLMRLYVVTPDEDITVTMEPKIKIDVSGMESPAIMDLGISEPISLGPGGAYVLRLPFIYCNKNGSAIPLEFDTEKRMNSAILLKDCFKFHYRKSPKWVDSV